MTPARHEFRDWRNYGLAVLSEAAAPLLRGAAHLVVRAPHTPPSDWRRGLVLGNGHIGDVLYRTASLDALGAGLPRCEWFYLTTPYAAELLRGNPVIREALPWMTATEPASALPAHRAALQRYRFDVALCTENVRVHAGLLTALAIGIPNRVAFTQKGMSGLATHGVRLERALPRPMQIRTMVAAITGTEPTGEPRPRVYPTGDDTSAASAEWDRVTTPEATRAIACAVTARQSVGVYPPELFAAILARVVEHDPGARIVLVGSSADGHLLGELAARIGPRAVVSAGRLGLRAMVAFLSRCRAFLGSDSGPRHLANAAGIPVFFIRNMGTSQTETSAYLSTEHDLAPPGEFLTPARTTEALRSIDPDAAAALILRAARGASDTHADTPR